MSGFDISSALPCLKGKICSSASPCLMDLKGLRVTQNTYFSLLTDTKQLLLLTLCDPTSGLVKWDRTPTMVRQRNVVGVKDFST